ncbi:MAG TPA: GrpB family protein [Thermoanaerobaculia bacterium]|nr:GrpB family protein [Thermoanaerobaculia bacterium]
MEPGLDLRRLVRTARAIKRLRSRIEVYGVETVEETFRRWQALRLPGLALSVREHDPEWADRFARERDRILPALGAVEIQHFGSTSIPPLPAKDIIDFFVAVDGPPVTPERVETLAGLGYELYGNSPVDPETVWFWSTRAGPCAFAAHVCQRGLPWLSTVVNFRDFLRIHPEERRRYEDAKRRLAREEGQDFLGYSVGKMALFSELNAKADAWHASGRGRLGPSHMKQGV